MSMNKQLQLFIKYLKDEKNYSLYTIENYSVDLEKFLIFLRKEGIDNLSKIDYRLLRNYLNVMSKEKYSSKTISRKLSSLRSFFKFLLKREFIEQNPMTLISNPKEEKKLPKYLNYKEIEKILEIPNQNNVLGLRNACLLELLYSTGIRVSEVISITIYDIDFTKNKIKILGKGNKERLVLFGDKCKYLLQKYFQDSRNLLNKKNLNYLFLSNLGNKLSVRGVEVILNKVVNEASLKFSISPHVLRHTFATHMLDNGADLNSVKELLGHENLNTTAIYAHVSNERLRRVYLDCHPRAKEK